MTARYLAGAAAVLLLFGYVGIFWAISVDHGDRKRRFKEICDRVRARGVKRWRIR